MPSKDLGRRRFEFLQDRDSRWPVAPRIVLGALAIAVMVLAYALRPGQEIQDVSRAAAPEAKPTVMAAAIVPIPTVAPAVAPAIPTAPVQRIHTVESGDTLSAIAKKYYSDASKWQKILDANKDVLKTAEALQLGQKLKIPD